MENFKPGWQKRRTTVSEILRNDEDNEKTYQKIVELLIAAGYFRARIQNLEPFDKVKQNFVKLKDFRRNNLDFNWKLLRCRH